MQHAASRPLCTSLDILDIELLSGVVTLGMGVGSVLEIPSAKVVLFALI